MTAANSLSPSNHCALISSLNQDELNCLNQSGSSRSLTAGEFLFHQHSIADYVYNLTEGMLMVERISSNGQRQVMAFLFPGDFLGFTHSEYFEFSAVAVTDAQLVCYSRKNFHSLCEKIPTLIQNVSQISNTVLSRIMDQVFALGQKKAHERLCFLLLQIHERNDKTDDNTINLAMSRQDIADYLGLTIETVSRALSRLKQDGVINNVNAHSVTVTDFQALTQLANIN